MAQGIVTSPDGKVSAILSSSNIIPDQGDSTSYKWSSTDAYWAAPILYRSVRFPDNGTGAFPFNQYGELMIQGTSFGSEYNRGISFLTWDGTSNEPAIRMRILGTGFIGIGTNTPDQPLTVNNSVKSAIEFVRGSSSGQLEQNSSGGAMRLQDLNGTTLIQLRTYGNSYFNGGNVGIGISTPAYLLDVAGTIRANEVKVNVQSGSDFVFKNNYKLMSLEDLEKYIFSNRHLPGIASEKEMVTDGMDMVNLEMKLLQKVEELTLYTIEQNKRMDEQNEKIKELQEEILSLKSK